MKKIKIWDGNNRRWMDLNSTYWRFKDLIPLPEYKGIELSQSSEVKAKKIKTVIENGNKIEKEFLTEIYEYDILKSPEGEEFTVYFISGCFWLRNDQNNIAIINVNGISDYLIVGNSLESP